MYPVRSHIRVVDGGSGTVGPWPRPPPPPPPPPRPCCPPWGAKSGAGAGVGVQSPQAHGPPTCSRIPTSPPVPLHHATRFPNLHDATSPTEGLAGGRRRGTR